ncbi:hypothetical protein J2W28_000786 [Variovorax boronicumulans]|uniref:DUF6134 family protein n=1 Tax=Variovorax boronicumulans TaxID=436515 RepID=UPI00278A9B09|nr:DUF6134 family protein [Variovorax boronicumulans]MDP9989835.1 hypothetical protein [Variovorax boronicumulans]MDQ0001658.1 hypothetical protein [Variovorax boronicumulans]
MRQTLFVLAALWCGAASAAGPASGEWNFRVLLDDSPIGEHRFALVPTGEERKLTSEAQFAVKLLGVTVYRYRHSATEQWRGDCLRQLASKTDDDGTPEKVDANATGDNALTVTTAKGTQSIDGCVMSFAYWNPALRKQERLLNSQSGKLEAVQVSRTGSGTVEVRGQQVAATRWRIATPAQPIDIWYSAEGEWIGLDSTVSGGRKLSYRLK